LQIMPARPWVAVVAGGLAATFTAFPYLTNGVFSYSASLAMAPGFAALIALYATRSGQVNGLIVVAAGTGVFVTHPAGALVAAILGGVVMLELFSRAPWLQVRAGLIRVASVTLGAAAISAPWLLAVGGVGVGAPAVAASVSGWTTAASMWLGLASPWTPEQLVLAMLAVAGVAITVLTRQAWSISLAWLVFGVLYVGVLVGDPSIARFTGPWYGNWYRLFAVIGLLVPVLAGLAIVAAASVTHAGAARMLPGARWARIAAPLAAALFLVAPAAYDAARGQSVIRTAWRAPALVTADDIGLFGELDRMAGEGDKVLNSPRDGSTWMYALFELAPVQPYVYGPALEISQLYSGAAPYDDPVSECERIEVSGATFALVKESGGDVTDLSYDIGGLVARRPDLFELAVTGPTATVYRIDLGALQTCVSRGAEGVEGS
jgi:hypothetical protein